MASVRAHVDASAAPGVRTAVVVAMKPQLRGRFRRNVETLLELGVRVVVVAVSSRKDFFVGLDSPLLSAELVEVPTFHRRFIRWLRRDDLRSAYAARLRLDRERRRHVRRTLRLRGNPGRMLRRLVTQRVFRHRYGRPLRAFPQWLLILAAVLAAPAVLLLGLLRAVARLSVGVLRRAARALGPGAEARLRSAAARGRVLDHRAIRWVLATLRPVARAGRLHVCLPTWRTWRATRARALGTVERLLASVSRVEGFVRFWAISERHVLAIRPDAVVTSDLPGLVGASRAARELGIRQVHDCHELYLESTSFRPWERRVLAPVERRHMRRAARVVVVNESIAQEYRRRYGVRADVVRNCANVPIGDEVRDLRSLAGLEPGVPLVLYQGGFTPGRGLDVVIAAMTGLPASVHLVMLGYGPMASDLDRLAAEHGVADRVHVLPAVPPEELLAFTASATVGVIPYQPVSRNNYYSLPNKIFEYTSVGLPVVASDLPELRRVVVDGGVGRVYDPFDPASLAAALTHALDPARIEAYRAAAHEYGRVNSWANERILLVDAFQHARTDSRTPRPHGTPLQHPVHAARLPSAGALTAAGTHGPG